MGSFQHPQHAWNIYIFRAAGERSEERGRAEIPKEEEEREQETLEREQKKVQPNLWKSS